MAEPNRTGAAFAALREHALSYPQTREDHPWGELVIKVRDKVFVFFGRPEGGLSLSVKLPGSAPFAFDLPYCAPTGYGLGRAGWVTARFRAGEAVPVEMLERWIDESYRAVAPKRLTALIGSAAAARPAAEPKTPASAKERAPGKRGPAVRKRAPHRRP
jgi:predicted DNA-binding protein (MmcQ/YjbR family)